ncbi:MAG: sulfotransferase [Candidatus Thermoplasmatota archaeon]|nr:sulfotransferase [Candidatus Thermoplasmatota archaeon]
MTDVILHIGIQGTGTTFLQEEIFPKLEGVNMISKREMEALEVLRSPKICIGDQEKLIAYLKNDKINLISDENIWWYHPDPWFQSNVHQRRIEHIDRIKEIFPDARIIFGIRDIDELIISSYNYYVMIGGTKRFKDFQKEFPFYSKEDFRYNDYIGHLKRLFGDENVYIYDYKEIKMGVNECIKGFCDFIGVDVPVFENRKRNASHSLWQLRAARFLNRFFRSRLNPKGFLPEGLNPQVIVFRSRFFPKRLRGRNPKVGDFL